MTSCLGGRNTEAALATALATEGRHDRVFGAFATDGVDGAIEAAGAIVDGTSSTRIRAAGIDPISALERNDSFTAFGGFGGCGGHGPDRYQRGGPVDGLVRRLAQLNGSTGPRLTTRLVAPPVMSMTVEASPPSLLPGR